LLVYFVATSLFWLGASYAYWWWARRPGGYQWKSVVGIALAYCILCSEALPFFWFVPESDASSYREVPDWVVVAGLLALGGLGTAGVVCFFSRLRSQRSLGVCPSEVDRLVSPSTKQAFGRARVALGQLQRTLAGRTGHAVPLVLSEAVAKPVLVGLNPHRIYVPFRVATAGEGLAALLEPLSEWATRWRYRAFMFLWWLSRLHLLLQPVTAGIRKAIEVELAREASADPVHGPNYLNANRAYSASRRHTKLNIGITSLSQDPQAHRGHGLPLAFPFLAIAMAACVVAARDAGRLSLGRIYESWARPPITVLSLHAYDPAVKFQVLPGRGGILPAGLVVDTLRDSGQAGCTTVRFPLGLIDAENYTPFGANAVNVHLEWRILAMAGGMVEGPALKITCSEQSQLNELGQHRLLTFYGRNIILPVNGDRRGACNIAIRLHPGSRTIPGSTDVVYGPVIYIPRGLKLELCNYLIDKIELKDVPPVPAGEAASFVSWYKRNGDRGAMVDLRWTDVAQNLFDE
jgi:hypothetical protein